MLLSRIRRLAEDAFLWLQGACLWFTLLIALQILMLVLWIGDVIKSFCNGDVRVGR